MAKSRRRPPNGQRREPGPSAPRRAGESARTEVRGSSAARRVHDESARLARTARRPRGGAGTRRAAPAATLTRQTKTSKAQIRPTGMLLRFISCGLITLAVGLVSFGLFHLRLRGPATTALGVLLMMSGFLTGGVLWYVRDSRLRTRDRRAMPDEQIIFSFVVFVVTPLAVTVVVFLVFLIALLVGFG